jgi:hypothetical protein
MKAITVEPKKPGTARLVSRRERPEEFARALERQSEDIKVVVEFAQA